jgi:hypothetical protein
MIFSSRFLENLSAKIEMVVAIYDSGSSPKNLSLQIFFLSQDTMGVD